MSKELEQIKKKNKITILKNPFKKNCVTRIYVNFSEGSWDKNKWEAIGSVEFKNGDTKGEQKFQAQCIDECVAKIKHFIDNELK